MRCERGSSQWYAFAPLGACARASRTVAARARALSHRRGSHAHKLRRMNEAEILAVLARTGEPRARLVFEADRSMERLVELEYALLLVRGQALAGGDDDSIHAVAQVEAHVDPALAGAAVNP